MKRAWTNKDKFTYIKAIHKNNYSLTKHLHMTTISSSPCPIKPSKNLIPKDLNLQKIFTTMMKSSQNLSKTYSSLVINNLNENINLNNSRKIYLKKIRDFFLSYNIDYKIYYKTIFLYDIIMIENENKKLLSSIEEIAVGALILSIKFNYDENKMFSMKKFLKFYGEEFHSLSEIFDIERKALKTINYFLNYTTPMCFLEFFLINGIIYNTDYLDRNEYYKIYFEIENILQKIMEESNYYLKYNFFYIACAIVAFCRDIFNLEKWPNTLKKVFSIDFFYFQNEYNFFFNKMNKAYDNKTYNSNNYNNKKNIIINGNNNIVLLDIENIDNSSLNNNINNNENNYTNNYSFINRNKNKYYKTIDHYNNIINININNVSFNNIFNNNLRTNFINEQKLNNNFISNRIHYKHNISSIFTNNNIRNNNDIKFNISFKNNIRSEKKNKSYINNMNNEVEHNNKIISEKKLSEIKEVKEGREVKNSLENHNYNSPPKIQKKHYFILNKDKKYNYNNDENENKIKEENKNDNNDNNKDIQSIKIEKNNEENKEEIKINSNNNSNNNNFNYTSIEVKEDSNEDKKEKINSNINSNNFNYTSIEVKEDSNEDKKEKINSNINSNNNNFNYNSIEVKEKKYKRKHFYHKKYNTSNKEKTLNEIKINNKININQNNNKNEDNNNNNKNNNEEQNIINQISDSNIKNNLNLSLNNFEIDKNKFNYNDIKKENNKKNIIRNLNINKFQEDIMNEKDNNNNNNSNININIDNNINNSSTNNINKDDINNKKIYENNLINKNEKNEDIINPNKKLINENKNNIENNKNNNNKNNASDKKPYNLLVSKYLNNNYYTEKKNLFNKSNIEINSDINNIKPIIIDNKIKENINNKSFKDKYDNSRILLSNKSYKNIDTMWIKKNNIENNNKYIKDKDKDKNKNKIKKKNKGENRAKYNDLIKLKLSQCESIKKRKNQRLSYVEN